MDFCKAKQLVHPIHMLQTKKETMVYMDITMWPIQTSSKLCNWKQEMEKLISLCQNKTGSRLLLTTNLLSSIKAEEEY